MRVSPAAVAWACFLRTDRSAATFSASTSITRSIQRDAAVADTPRAEERPFSLTADGDDGIFESRPSGAKSWPSVHRNTRTAVEGEEGDERRGSDHKPELSVSVAGTGRNPVPLNQEEQDGGPGAHIEEMDEHWTEHTSSIQPPGSVLENARSVYSAISNEILTRWGYKYASTPLFSGGMKFSDGGAVLEEKMLNAVVEQRGFLAAFTGVSTTAGHDCLYEQSYPIVLNKTFGRLMAATGVQFEAINVAMGNTRVAPYSYCVEAHAGLEADLISWDMSMMATSHECGRAATAVELFIRSASVLPKRPVVLLTDASPRQDVCTSRRLHRIQQLDNGLTGSCIPSRDLAIVYREFGLHQISPRSLVPEVTCGDDIFAFERLFNNTEKDFPRPVSWHAGPTGHLLVADMIFMAYAEVFLRALERLDEALPGITAAGLRNQEFLSANSRLRLSASLGVERRDSTSDPVHRHREMTAIDNDNGDIAPFMGGGRGDILPPPAWCKGWRFCEWAGNYRCATTSSPLAGKHGSRLVDMVSERTPVILNRNRSQYFVEPSQGHWAVTLNEEAPIIKDYLKVPPPEGFHHPIDFKWVLVGDAASGPIEFEFETIGFPSGRIRRRRAAVEEQELEEDAITNSDGQEQSSSASANGNVHSDNKSITSDSIDIDAVTMATVIEEVAEFDSRVTVCKPDFIERVEFNETSEVRFSVDGIQVETVELVQYGLYTRSCVLLDTEVGVGRHTVKVEPLQLGEPYVAISHVLYPA